MAQAPRRLIVGALLLLAAAACVLVFVSLVQKRAPALADAGDGAMPGMAAQAEGYADPEVCAGCHAAQAGAWAASDHAWAMRKAAPGNVLGDFSDAHFSDGAVTARFFRRGDDYYVNTDGPDGRAADFRILYTFGYRPLQQYLVAMPGGRLQSLTIAWDSRPKVEGGQRWYSLYPGQRFRPDDPLHWTGRSHNWNGMCADCHSTALAKNYDDVRDRFATTWHEQTVGCQSCHGPAQAHVDWARQHGSEARRAGAKPGADDVGLSVDFARMDGHRLIEQCARCHSRRQTLGTLPTPGAPLLDSMLPLTLQPELYFADGQIHDEVYVYGSFVQSKMYHAGVTCLNCHDVHSTRVKIQGNGLCLQCHNAQPPAQFPQLRANDYDSTAHHHHAAGSAGAQCVNCHMPARIYMGVDARRDHSFRIPRPDLDAGTGSPDACTGCHRDRQPDWAAAAIGRWFAHPARPHHYGEVLQAARQTRAGSAAELAGLLADRSAPAIARATAAEALAQTGAGALPSLAAALRDADGLVRARAVSAVADLAPDAGLPELLPLLDDPLRAVRDETLRALSRVPVTALPAERRAAFSAALADYEKRLRADADLPGNRFNLATLFEGEGRTAEAHDQYRSVLAADPYFSPARVNLATLASGAGQGAEAERVLSDGIALPDTPDADRAQMAYMLGLLLADRGQAGEALRWLDQALAAQPGDARIRYNQALLLVRAQRWAEAEASLQAGLAKAPDDIDLLFARLYLHTATGQRELAGADLARLAKLAPGDPRLAQYRPARNMDR